jgi:hypothetical protein
MKALTSDATISAIARTKREREVFL